MSIKGLTKATRAKALEVGMTKVESTGVFCGDAIKTGGSYVVVRKAREGKGEVVTDVDVTCRIEVKRDLTPWDRAVHDAAATLVAAGNRWLTANMIYRTMTGRDRRCSHEVEAEIEASLRLMSQTDIVIDATKEAHMRGIPARTLRFTGALLPIDKIEREEDDTESRETYYRVLRQSPLYDYTVILTHQKRDVPLQLLDTPIDNSVRSMTLQDWLLHEIVIREWDRTKRKNPVTTAALYDLTGAGDKRSRQHAREKVERLLDFWTAEKLISGWEPVKKDRTVTGYKIRFAGKPEAL